MESKEKSSEENISTPERCCNQRNGERRNLCRAYSDLREMK